MPFQHEDVRRVAMVLALDGIAGNKVSNSPSLPVALSWGT